MTPLVIFTCLTTAELVEQARILWKGLYLATYLAILPVSVRQTNISTLLSIAIVQAVVAIKSTDDKFLELFIESCLISLYTCS